MLKHVQISPLRNRSDSVSLRSSTSCASSMCGSPEPPSELQRTPSRASSYSSLNEHLPQTTIKIFTNCLKIDIEYKTLGIQWDTSSKEVISQLLRRLKMRHRDPRLFYLSMEVSVRRAGVKTILVLDDDTRPAILQACHPKGESRFCLQLKPGGLIRVHTSALQPSSQYKSLIISEETTSDELLQLLLSCYNSIEPVEHFSIYEVCPGQEYQRKLHPDDLPLRAQTERMKRGETCHFLVRRNPSYVRRRQLLTSLNDVVTQAYDNSITSESISPMAGDDGSLLDMSIESISDDLRSLLTTSDEDEDSASSTSGSSDNSSESSTNARRTTTNLSLVPIKSPALAHDVCAKCRNTFKSCEFCHKNSTLMPTTTITTQLPSYSPVYNIREIRTVSHSFSSLGSDKKLLDIQLNAHFDPTTPTAISPPLTPTATTTTTTKATTPAPICRIRPHSVYVGRAPRMIMDAHPNASRHVPNNNNTDVNGNNSSISMNSHNNTHGFSQSLHSHNGGNVICKSDSTAIISEAVNNNPARGLGHYVYL